MIAITVKDIELAVLSLNISESLDYANLNVLHILHTHPLMFTDLKQFNNIIRFGKVPLNFGKSVRDYTSYKV